MITKLYNDKSYIKTNKTDDVIPKVILFKSFSNMKEITPNKIDNSTWEFESIETAYYLVKVKEKIKVFLKGYNPQYVFAIYGKTDKDELIKTFVDVSGELREELVFKRVIGNLFAARFKINKPGFIDDIYPVTPLEVFGNQNVYKGSSCFSSSKDVNNIRSNVSSNTIKTTIQQNKIETNLTCKK